MQEVYYTVVQQITVVQTHMTQAKCLINYYTMKLITQVQAFPLIHFAYAHVTQTTFQIVATLSVKHFKFQQLLHVGQRNGIVPSTVRTRLDRGWLKSSQYIQPLSKMCTTINYTVFSWQNVSLELHPDGPCSKFSDKTVHSIESMSGLSTWI